jgi:hypothetical protein
LIFRIRVIPLAARLLCHVPFGNDRHGERGRILIAKIAVLQAFPLVR